VFILTKIISLDQIKKVLQEINPIKEIEEGFVAYSNKKVVVPPVGEMIFEKPPGDVHIKYGYINEDDYFVIKIASGFYENESLGLPSYSGLMLLFNQKTGELISVMLDEGYLTNIRTAAAGAVVAKYLAPKKVKCIGIYGTGVQARLQLEYLKSIIDCKDVIAWGRNEEKLVSYAIDMTNQGYNVKTTMDSKEVTEACNLIVTCTAARTPIITADQITEGTHITAMGSDTPVKQELDAKILQKADRVVADSIDQVLTRGECYHAFKANLLSKEKLVELGHVIQDKNLQRQSDEEVTIADLTGVAVQDIQITKAIWNAVNKS